MHQQSKQIRHKPVIAESFAAQIDLQFLVSILTFAALHVLIVNTLRQDCRSEAVGHDRATIRSGSMAFGFDDTGSGSVPSVGLVRAHREQPLLLPSCCELFCHPHLVVKLPQQQQARIARKASAGILDDQGFSRMKFQTLGSHTL